jgi:hypothetical protein
MSYIVTNYRISRSPFGVGPFVLALLLTASCSNWRRNEAQRTFSSPEEAGAALLAAAQSGNRNTLIAIFGPDSKDVVFTGDSETDKSRLLSFATAYGLMHRWVPLKAGGQVLQVGADSDPFPIPLDRDAAGRWQFDTAAGKDEIMARRIGKNELTAMDASQAIADAQRRYYQDSKGKQYAQKFVSDPGNHDGLYWPAGGGEAPSPLGEMGAFTEVLRRTKAGEVPLFKGYYYRLLTVGDTPSTRGFTVLAYPAEYRNSGITSFMAGPSGKVYQKDLGESTAEVATGLKSADPRDGWTPASSEETSASRMQQ